MGVNMKKIFLIICIFVLGNLNIAKAISVTQTTHWDALDIDVITTYPDKVTYGDPFSISFFIDSSDLGTYDMMAFIPKIWISNTVDIADAQWSEEYLSLDLGYHGNFEGDIGDQYSPYAYDSASNGYNITLFDPFFSEYYGSNYTWLEKSYNDRVTWSLNNFIIRDNTSFKIELDSGIWLGSGFQTNFVVFDPPANVPMNSAVPEPATLSLLSSLACGIFFLKKKKSH
jgi:hypothetical protein